MKTLTFNEIEETKNLTASYIDNKDSICEELDYLGIEYNRFQDDVFELIAKFASDDIVCDDDSYQVTDMKKVEKYNA